MEVKYSMNIIIDTHIFLWLASDLKKINKKYFEYIENTDNNIYLSSLSIAEIMIKKSIGNLDFDGDILLILDEMGIDILDFDASSALFLGTLPFHHRDPFDRMIISQAITKKYKII
ncbi:MAG: type II toxin-antitoxin system VapC family toxin, partial [Campylobacterota bacterium]|nr:type II toxin-antitoxin system VapC family toxin [Campylobacterota bacterium]